MLFSLCSLSEFVTVHVFEELWVKLEKNWKMRDNLHVFTIIINIKFDFWDYSYWMCIVWMLIECWVELFDISFWLLSSTETNFLWFIASPLMLINQKIMPALVSKRHYTIVYQMDACAVIWQHRPKDKKSTDRQMAVHFSPRWDQISSAYFLRNQKISLGVLVRTKHI